MMERNPEPQLDLQLEDEKAESGVQREIPDLPEAEKQFVSKWQARIRAAKKHFDSDFF